MQSEAGPGRPSTGVQPQPWLTCRQGLGLRGPKTGERGLLSGVRVRGYLEGRPGRSSRSSKGSLCPDSGQGRALELWFYPRLAPSLPIPGEAARVSQWGAYDGTLAHPTPRAHLEPPVLLAAPSRQFFPSSSVHHLPPCSILCGTRSCPTPYRGIIGMRDNDLPRITSPVGKEETSHTRGAVSGGCCVQEAHPQGHKTRRIQKDLPKEICHPINDR
ncbi:uncharacterized protein LOC134738716 [Pongo pygmaeus]|uniref:uncharacterized protein LOC134738716 n=1 Tax=Pongo pygmaeus TaxID=9600 RepID=UPI00300DA8C3